MILPFTYQGRTRTLAKHPSVRSALKAGTITPEEVVRRPWYLRLTDAAGKERSFKLPAKDSDAIRAAKDILRGRVEQPVPFTAWLAERDAARATTFATLSTEWLALGLPDEAGRARTPAAATQLRKAVTRAIRYFGQLRPAKVNRTTMNEFAAWRRLNTPRGQGDRSADLELAALSSLCAWAVSASRIEKNPFAERERYRDPDSVKHCHDHMPDNDDQFHAVLRWFWSAGADLETIQAGAYLAFCALSGLRPGEPLFLRRVPAALEFPTDLQTSAPGLTYPMPDGSWRMKVHRLKHGQNPAILIHSVLDDFLNHWRTWIERAAGVAPADHLFPSNPNLNKLLNRACAELGIRRMKPHGFGRAYYVRVRRSQGADDATIAVELGQTSNGELIRSTYGSPRDPVGGNLHDWLPKEGAPAWHQIPAPKVGSVADDTVNDTTARNQVGASCEKVESENPPSRQLQPSDTARVTTPLVEFPRK